MALTKVTEVTLLAITKVTNNTATVASAVDVSTYYAGDVRIRFGRVNGTALTTFPVIRIEGSYKTSPGAMDWVSLASVSPALGASIGSSAITSGGGSGSSSVVLTTTTNFNSGDYLFFWNSGTPANSEWKWAIQDNAGTVALQDALINAQTSSNVANQAEIYHVLLDLTSIEKLRIVASNTSGQDIVVEAGLGAVSGL